MRIAFIKSGPVAEELKYIEGQWRDNSIELIWDMFQVSRQYSVFVTAIDSSGAHETTVGQCHAITFLNGARNPLTRRLMSMYLCYRQISAIRHFQPDMVVISDLSHLSWKLAGFRRQQIHVVVNFARQEHISPYYLHLLKKYRVKWFIAPSTMFKQALDKHGIDAEVMIRTPTYPSQFFSENLQETDWTDDFHFLYTGRLETAKGVFELLEAFERIHAEFVKTNLVLVGVGTAKRDLEQRVAKKRLSNSVYFVGKKTNVEVGAYLRNSDVLVFPSYTEGFSKTWYEAFLCGIPSIFTQLPSICEYIKGADCAELVPVKSVDRLVEAMRRLYLDSQRREELKNNMRELLKTKGKTHNFYQCVMEYARRLEKN